MRPYLLAKASFFKHAGDLSSASACADEMRKLDLADRYLNSICTKRMLQAGAHEEAERTIALFTRDGDQAGGLLGTMGFVENKHSTDVESSDRVCAPV
jgi:hypothetical protein